MITVALDNGTSGSCGILGGTGCPDFFSVPTKDCLHYSKGGKLHKRIDKDALVDSLCLLGDGPRQAFIERPFTGGPMMFNISSLAMRAYEAVLISLEDLAIGYTTVDSKAWQKALLPGIVGSANLKKASRLKGCELYPALAPYINAHKDADGLLIAHYYHNK